MKKILVSTALILTITLITGTAFARTGTVNTDDLNLRESASTSADVITVLDKNTKVEVIEEQDDWYKVSYNGKEGYLKKQYVDAEAVSTPETTPSPSENNNDNNNGNVNNNDNNSGNVNNNDNNNNENNNENNTTTSNEFNLLQDAVVYVLPILNSTKMANLPTNTKVEVISKVGKWYYVMTDNTAGWILASKVSEPSSNVDNNQTTNENNNENNNTNGNNNGNNNSSENNSTNSGFSKTMYVNVDAVNVREKTTTDSDVIASVEKNTEVKVTGESGDWYSVTVSGNSGYIMKQYLSNNKS